MSDKRVVVITGGASGIGWATVLKCLAAGDRVVIADRAPGPDASARMAAGDDLHFAEVDVADDASVAAMAETIIATHGAPHGLVTCAGILETPKVSWLADMDRHDAIWRVNYRGTYVTIRALGPAMSATKRGGAIVTVGSINSFRPLPLPAYNPSKVAIKGLTELLAVEYGPYGIRVNGVAPTYTMTPPVLAKIDAGERDESRIRRAHALDMRVTPSHIADGIMFLLSEQAAAITGHMLPVDAGWNAAQTYRHFVGPVEGYEPF
jgi:NAD(P)-dependent dehydrogenase (short-subunit alcohol dehydrogenase family)